MESFIHDEVNKFKVIDVHSHLFSYDHNELCLYGIDHLLTYHYLISELFVVCHDIKLKYFFSLSKNKQADIIWEELFLKRTPISEACKGVITTLNKLGLSNLIKKRDLNEIRKVMKSNSININKYIELIFEKSNVEYTIMTNQIFNHKEIYFLSKNFIPKQNTTIFIKNNNDSISAKVIDTNQSLLPKEFQVEYTNKFNKKKTTNINSLRQEICKWSNVFIPELEYQKITKRFKTSMRIDDLINDYRSCIKNPILEKYGFNKNFEGIMEYIRYWNHFLKPIYFMASIKYDFCFDPSEITQEWNGSPSQVIDRIIIPLAIELNLPIALKFGTNRSSNPNLKDSGDGVGTCDMKSLINLCKTYSDCKFLVTFLSETNQHELCVLSRNFPNLHIYGCWWYLNNPSLIEKITKMRFEMLGLGFTAQHSDARILEQLLYKWDHSKQIIAKILVEKYKDLQKVGWILTKDEIKRDIAFIFKNSFLQFIKN